MEDRIFKGCATAVITPFKDNKIDYEAFGKIIDFQIESKIDALVILGTTGESACLSDAEKDECMKFAIKKIKGRVPAIIGTGSNCTEHAKFLSQNASNAGADAVLLVTPYYNKATQYGIYKHYEYIAEYCDRPFIVYNVPSRTGLNIEPETYKMLCEIKNVKAIKEANGKLDKLAETKKLVGDRLDVYSGNDDQIFPILELGGMGVVSVLSNIMPYETSNLCKLYFESKKAEAEKLQNDYQELIKLLFCEVNPIPVKKAMEFMGYCSNEIKLPLTEMSSGNAEKLKAEMKKFKLI